MERKTKFYNVVTIAAIVGSFGLLKAAYDSRIEVDQHRGDPFRTSSLKFESEYLHDVVQRRLQTPSLTPSDRDNLIRRYNLGLFDLDKELWIRFPTAREFLPDPRYAKWELEAIIGTAPVIMGTIENRDYFVQRLTEVKDSLPDGNNIDDTAVANQREEIGRIREEMDKQAERYWNGDDLKKRDFRDLLYSIVGLILGFGGVVSRLASQRD